MPTGCFVVSCSSAAAGLSDTCVWVCTFLRQDCTSQANSHSCAKPAGPRAWFSARGPSEGSWSGEWARKAYFWNSRFAGGLEERGRGCAGGTEGSGENPGSGFCLRVQAGLGSLQAPIWVSVSSFCRYGNNPLTQVLCMFSSSCGLVGTWAGPLPLDAEIWGGAVGGSWLVCMVTSTLRRKTQVGRSAQPPKLCGAPGSPVGRGATCVASC